MSNQRSYSQSSLLPTVLLSVVFAFLGLVYFAGHYKYLTVAAAAVAIYLLTRRDLSRLRSLPAILLLLYVGFSGLTRLWAISGKFFLIEFSKIFIAATAFLAVMLCRKFDRRTVRSIMLVIVGVSTIYSVLSVEAATLGISKRIISAVLPSFMEVATGFETGTRLTGIIGNANVLSSVVALGIIFSISLLCGEENDRLRPVYAGVTAINAFTFLLLFSMGGTACFILAILVYLIFAGEKRGSALVRMLECALPTLLWVFVAFPFFNREGAVVIIPLLALVGDIITVILLEKTLAPKLILVLEQRAKLVWGMLAGVIALVCVYVVLGMTLTGAHTFGTDALRRSSYPAVGAHTLTIQADGEVNVTITSQNMSEVMMHTETVLYSGSAAGASFTVPEGSKVCYFTFTAQPGVVLEDAILDSGESLKLNYTLLPGFVANRLQGLKANQNAIQRTVFFRDGMKMFYQSPIVGNGVGSFETGITSVQDFFYETKYIHNHYIQILLETGVLGFVPFVGSLLGMIWLLLKRRKDEEWKFRGEYPALWAALTMTICHMMVEVSMSIIVFIWIAFVTFALVIRCCSNVPEQVPAAKGAERSKQRGKEQKVKLACALLPAVFVISLLCNIAANRIVNGGASSNEAFLSNLEIAAKLDPYEANDAKLSYVMNVYAAQMGEHLEQANGYADQLLEQQSNSIPLALLPYYLGTSQYDKALEAAKAGAAYSASNADVWNDAIQVLRGPLLRGAISPLVIEDDPIRAQLLSDSLEYYTMLQERNANSMESIALTASSKDFFSKILALSETDLSKEQAIPILLRHIFDLRTSCDADQDNIPDQVPAHSGTAFHEGGVDFQAGGQMQLELLTPTGGMAQVVVTCAEPAAVVAMDASGMVLNAAISGNQAIFDLPLILSGEQTTILTISSSMEQTVENVTVYINE